MSDETLEVHAAHYRAANAKTLRTRRTEYYIGALPTFYVMSLRSVIRYLE